MQSVEFTVAFLDRVLSAVHQHVNPEHLKGKEDSKHDSWEKGVNSVVESQLTESQFISTAHRPNSPPPSDWSGQLKSPCQLVTDRKHLAPL